MPETDPDAVWLVFVTAPPAVATELARRVVDERLVACAQRVPGVNSVYRWEGKVCEEVEELLILKTRAGRFEALRARLVELHPYDVPEIVALSAREGLPAYLRWVAEQTREV